MHVLVSFCHVKTPGRPVLGLLDTRSLEFALLAVPERASYWRGLTGLALDERYLYAAPIGTGDLLIFDRADLSLVAAPGLRLVAGAHSMWVKESTLYVASSGTDELVALALREANIISEQVVWRPTPEAVPRDRHHLNAVVGWKDELFVSGFGKKDGERWSSATNGFIANVSTGELVATGIYHPHSLTICEGGIAYCESAHCLVRKLGIDLAARLPGYTRGLCVADGKLFAATSSGREILSHISDATVPAPPALTAVAEGRCTISRLSLDRFEVEATRDLGLYAREIYDLIPVEGAGSWPTLDEVAWRDEALQGLEGVSPPSGCETRSPVAVGAPDRTRLTRNPHPTKAFIDRVSGRAASPFHHQPQVVYVNGSVAVEGWAVDDTTDRAAAGVFVVIDGSRRIWAPCGGNRPDVAQAFGIEAYRRSGYVALIPPEALPPGQHSLTLEVVAPARRSYFETDEWAVIDVAPPGDRPAIAAQRDRHQATWRDRLRFRFAADRRGSSASSPRGPIPMPPPELIAVVGGGTPERFKEIGDAFLRYFIGLGGLRQDHRVLDVGCGVGRMAIPLTTYLSEQGSYEGFDVRPDLIAWCQDNISSRYSNFTFTAADIHNGQTNPQGTIRDEVFTFPYSSESFDFVIVTSVFTHMLLDGVERYLQEISRVMKAGGRCLATFFLINGEALQLIAAGKSQADDDGTGQPHPLHFAEERGGYRVEVPHLPEAVVGYDEAFVLASLDRNGLQLEPPIRYGWWCGRSREFALSFQDIVIAHKR